MSDPTPPDEAPTDDALAHSARLQALIREQIAAAGGAIPFWRFMELALYAPGLGYYSAGATKFGGAGDFVTAPELGPLFAECVAGALAPALRQLGPQARFLEIGAGSGRFAGDAIAQLLELEAMPARYAILEPSADLRERQRAHLQAALPPGAFARVEWLQGPMPDDWRGVLFANEVLDALPTPRFAVQGGQVFEEHVALDGDGFCRIDRPADLAPLRHVLGQVDGAAVFDGEGVMRQLGSRIVPSSTAEAALDSYRGMRHTAARLFSYDDPSATVIVVSEDGPVTVWRRGSLLGRSETFGSEPDDD